MRAHTYKSPRSLRTRFPYGQRGVGFAGWLVIILLLGGLLSVGTKLVPIYMNNNTISGLMDKLSEEPDVAMKSKGEIFKILTNRLKLNNIRDFKVEENMEVVRTKDGSTLVLDYEARVPVVGNIDLIASFNKEVSLR
ncbi:MAG: DUF4845 domain-containing protein [Pseudomonadales bacterium]|jgi:hypothetical protein